MTTHPKTYIIEIHLLKLDKGPNDTSKTSTIKSGSRKLKLVPETARILTWILGWINCFNLSVQQIVFTLQNYYG